MNDREPYARSSTTETKLASWASRFILETAEGKHDKLYSLENFSDEQHEALSSVVCDAFASRAAKLRAAAAWITGELRCPPHKALQLLRAGFRDRTERVRRACAWAAGKQLSHASLFASPLTTALDDHAATVRFGALFSLEALGHAGSVAIPRLLRLSESTNTRDRGMAVRALAAIGPGEKLVKTRLIQLLNDEDDTTRGYAILGLGRSATNDPNVVKRIAAMLSDDDPGVRLLAVNAIRQLRIPNREAVVALLELMAREEWYYVKPYPGEEACRISIRSDMASALANAVDSIDDETLADFRLLFFDFAFREDHAGVKHRAEMLAHHDFVEKVLRKRLGKPRSKSDRDLIEQLVREAQEKFAQRLRNNPTLSLPPHKYNELPKWIKVISRTIAGNLWRSLKRRRARAARQRRVSSATLWFPSVEFRELRELIFIENRPALTEDERIIAGLDLIGGHSLTAIAAILGFSESQVKTRRNHAKRKIAKWLKDHS